MLERINKIDKHLAGFMKNKKENAQINQIRDEREEITMYKSRIKKKERNLNLKKAADNFIILCWRT